MTKGCKAYAVEISAYFDGELSEDDHQRVQAHLEGCAGCRDTLRRLGKLHDAMHVLAQPKMRRRSILQDLQERLADEDALSDAPKPLVS